MSEITEEERKKLKLPKDIPLVEVNGETLINLNQPTFTKKVQQFFPFTQLMDEKGRYFLKVLEELQKRKPVKHNIIPFDIFIIEFDSTPIKEDKNDKESE